MAHRDICRSLGRHLKKTSRFLSNEAAVEVDRSSNCLVKVVAENGRLRPFLDGRKALSGGQIRSPYLSNPNTPSTSLFSTSLGFSNRPMWTPFSTVSEGQQRTTVTTVEKISVDTLNESVETEIRASVQEFVPPTESPPRTPLVDAIESHNFASLETSELPPDDSSGSAIRGTSNAGSSLSEEDAREITPTRVYIGGLPFDIRGEELIRGVQEACEQYGPVKAVSLSRYRDQSAKSIEAGKHRGFVFVTMETPEQAQALIDNLNGSSLWGRAILVSYGFVPRFDQSKKPKVLVRCKVFVGNLHENTTRADLERHFKEHGPISSMKLITDFVTKRSRGFAFITFHDERDAVRAVLDRDGSILEGSVINVNIAKYPQAD